MPGWLQNSQERLPASHQSLGPHPVAEVGHALLWTADSNAVPANVRQQLLLEQLAGIPGPSPQVELNEPKGSVRFVAVDGLAEISFASGLAEGKAGFAYPGWRPLWVLACVDSEQLQVKILLRLLPERTSAPLGDVIQCLLAHGFAWLMRLPPDARHLPANRNHSFQCKHFNIAKTRGAHVVHIYIYTDVNGRAGFIMLRLKIEAIDLSAEMWAISCVDIGAASFVRQLQGNRATPSNLNASNLLWGLRIVAGEHSRVEGLDLGLRLGLGFTA